MQFSYHEQLIWVKENKSRVYLLVRQDKKCKISVK